MKISMNDKMHREYIKIKEINYNNQIDFDVKISSEYNVILLNQHEKITVESVRRGIKFLGGKMRYEIENNEIYINDYAKKDDIQEIIKMGFIIARKLELEFEKLDIKNICIIISIDSGNNGNLTFYEIVDDNSWLASNLENYDELIAILIIS